MTGREEMKRMDTTELIGFVIQHAESEAVEQAAHEVMQRYRGGEDPYAQRVEEFHQAVEDNTDANYLQVYAEHVFGSDAMPGPAGGLPRGDARAGEIAALVAERNRLFWSSFLSEESGEVASALNDGDPPESFREEVADVLVLCFAMADVFGFSMRQAFDEVMLENEQKPFTDDGTGKMPDEAREEWED